MVRRGNHLQAVGERLLPEISRIEVPQTKAEIEKFAAENKYKIQWQGEIPEEPSARAS